MFSFNTLDSASDTAVAGYHSLRIGIALFLVSSGLLLLTHGILRYHPLVFGLFFLTNITNIVAASFVLYTVKNIFSNKWFHIIVYLLSFPIFLFALLSSLDFFSYATNVFLPLPHLINATIMKLGATYYGQPVSELGVIALTYVYLLPLQVVVYMIFLMMIGTLSFLGKRNGNRLDIPPTLILSLVIFLVMAILALGDAFFIFLSIRG